jgi:hypothetical protein
MKPERCDVGQIALRNFTLTMQAPFRLLKQEVVGTERKQPDVLGVLMFALVLARGWIAVYSTIHGL